MNLLQNDTTSVQLLCVLEVDLGVLAEVLTFVHQDLQLFTSIQQTVYCLVSYLCDVVNLPLDFDDLIRLHRILIAPKCIVEKWKRLFTIRVYQCPGVPKLPFVIIQDFVDDRVSCPFRIVLICQDNPN